MKATGGKKRCREWDIEWGTSAGGHGGDENESIVNLEPEVDHVYALGVVNYETITDLRKLRMTTSMTVLSNGFKR